MRRASHGIQDLGGRQESRGRESTGKHLKTSYDGQQSSFFLCFRHYFQAGKKLNHQRNSGKRFVKFAEHPVWMQCENASSSNIRFTVMALLYNDNWKPIKGKRMWRLSALSWVYTSLGLSRHKLNAIWWVETERLEIRLRVTAQLCEWKQKARWISDPLDDLFTRDVKVLLWSQEALY